MYPFQFPLNVSISDSSTLDIVSLTTSQTPIEVDPDIIQSDTDADGSLTLLIKMMTVILIVNLKMTGGNGFSARGWRKIKV